MYCYFVVLKVLDAAKTSFAQYLTRIKCHFYLLNCFLYTIRTHYEKLQKRICFLEIKGSFWIDVYYVENRLQNMHNYLFLAHCHVNEKI
jgi:hypothetical protein